MRITIVQGAFFPVPPLMGGAVEKVWSALGTEFAQRGHRVTHISRQHPDLPKNESMEGVEHRRVRGFDAPRSLIWSKALDLIYSLRALRMLPVADVVITNTFWLPMLIRSHRWGKLYVHVQRYPKRQMGFYRHAARIQTVSTHIADAICSQTPAIAKKVVVIPNPLSQSQKSVAVRTENTRVLLYVGRVHPEKGVNLLLRALVVLGKQGMDGWKLRVVGPAKTSLGGGGDEFLDELKVLAKPIEDSVEWIGAEFDPIRLNAHYAAATLFVYPSVAEFGEACPLAPVEAMAAGCVPVVSNLDCFRDYITDGKTGYFFDHRADDPVMALAEKLTELFKDPKSIRAVGKRALLKANEFKLSRIADRYLTDFKKLNEDT